MRWTRWAISRSSQCPMTGVTKAVVYVIPSVVWKEMLYFNALNTFYLWLYGVALWDDANKRTLAANQKD